MEESSPEVTASSSLRAYASVVAVHAACALGFFLAARTPAFIDPWLDSFEYMRVLLIGIAILGILLLGREQRKQVLGSTPEAKWLLIGPFLGALIYLGNLGWIDLVRFLGGEAPLPVDPDFHLWSLLLAPMLVSYSEELVFRGVLWAGLSHVCRGPLPVILQTSSLFAILHLINGHGLVEVPHRFVAALVLGYIRHRSGSLWPAMHAHFVTNFLSAIH